MQVVASRLKMIIRPCPFGHCDGLPEEERQYFDHLIRNEQDFYETIWYIRLNPVKAKLVEDWREWPYYGEPDFHEELE
jgi:REP element-mobilizing transposase RayT